MKIQNPVSKFVGKAVDQVKEVAPRIAKAAGSVTADTFAAPARQAQDLVGGLPGLPSLEELRQTAKGAGDRLSNLFGDVQEQAGNLLESAKGKTSELLGTVKEGLIYEGLDAVFEALDALPGEIDQKKLNKVMELGGVTAPERTLTDAERATLESVYGDSIDYDALRIREGDIGIFNNNNRALVLGNTILMPPENLKADGSIPGTLLVHEAMHVWQFQNGGVDYIKESVQDQLAAGQGAYNIDGALANHTPWNELRTEPQAVVIEKAFKAGLFNTPPRPYIVDGVDHSDYVRGLVEQIRAGQGAPGGPGDD